MPKNETLPQCVMLVDRSLIPVEIITDGKLASPGKRVVVFEREEGGTLCTVALPVGYRLSKSEVPGDVLQVLNYTPRRHKKLG